MREFHFSNKRRKILFSDSFNETDEPINLHRKIVQLNETTVFKLLKNIAHENII